MKILVGLSGGVDSAAAAALLKEQGHEVIGAMMTIWDGEAGTAMKKHSCYGPDEAEDLEEAAAAAAHLGISFHRFHLAQEYRKIVVDDFRSEYLSARTPNPCVRCNHRLKFGLLPDAAKRAGIDFEYFATGHYARIDREGDHFVLKKGCDPKKDQSYFLYRLNAQQLSKSLFPLGGMTKAEVRAHARRVGLEVADKCESQDFYSGDYKELIGAGARRGDIVDLGGHVLGEHSGTWNFTPGQRRGIGISAHEPLYVVELDAARNRVVVGPRESAAFSGFTLREEVWNSGRTLNGDHSLSVRLRSNGAEIRCVVSHHDDGNASVVLSEPSLFISPGQSAVFYDGDCVAGGGIIDCPRVTLEEGRIQLPDHKHSGKGNELT
jgi:tRNA-specific 2-thiouridylase